MKSKKLKQTQDACVWDEDGEGCKDQDAGRGGWRDGSVYFTQGAEFERASNIGNRSEGKNEGKNEGKTSKNIKTLSR